MFDQLVAWLRPLSRSAQKILWRCYAYVVSLRREEVIVTGIEEPDTFSQRVQDTLIGLRVQLERINRTYNRLKTRDSDCFRTCVRCVESGETERAKIFAGEVAEVRKLASLVLHSQLVLERVKLRVETMHEIGDIVGDLVPMMAVVEQVREEVMNVIPETESVLAEVNQSLETLFSTSVGAVVSQRELTPELDEEARRILLEARELAANRIKDAFPELPREAAEALEQGRSLEEKIELS